MEGNRNPGPDWLGCLWTASRVRLGLGLALLAVELLLTLGLCWGLIWPI